MRFKKSKHIKTPAYRRRPSVLNDLDSTTGKVILLGWLLPAFFFQLLTPKIRFKEFIFPHIFFIFFTHNFFCN